MITNFKLYEDLNNPVVGHYVICETDDSDIDKTLSNYMKNNIGRIVKIKASNIEENGKKLPIYHIKYKEITEDDYDINTADYSMVEDTTDTFLMWRDEIKFWSNNKEDLEIILTAKKYNL